MTEVNEVRSMSKSFVHWTSIPSLASSKVSLESRIVPGNATRAPPGRATLEETRGWGTPHTQSSGGDSGPLCAPTVHWYLGYFNPGTQVRWETPCIPDGSKH